MLLLIGGNWVKSREKYWTLSILDSITFAVILTIFASTLIHARVILYLPYNSLTHIKSLIQADYSGSIVTNFSEHFISFNATIINIILDYQKQEII